MKNARESQPFTIVKLYSNLPFTFNSKMRRCTGIDVPGQSCNCRGAMRATIGLKVRACPASELHWPRVQELGRPPLPSSSCSPAPSDLGGRTSGGCPAFWGPLGSNFQLGLPLPASRCRSTRSSLEPVCHWLRFPWLRPSAVPALIQHSVTLQS